MKTADVIDVSAVSVSQFAGSCMALRESVAAQLARVGDTGTTEAVMRAVCNGDVLAYGGSGAARGETLYSVADGVALIPVVGVMMRSDSEVMWGGVRYGTSHAMIRRALAQTQADESVKARVLVIDSPGGVADGAVALGEDVKGARGGGGKPLEAFTIGAYSAAMWLAAQTSRITMEKGSGVGSIGTYMVARDFSKALEDFGVKSILISSGGVKGQGAFGVPISEAAVEHWQGTVDQYTAYFVDAVAAGRGMGRDAVAKLANGREYLGRAAVDVGLVDEEGTLASVVQRLAKTGGANGGMNGLQGRTAAGADGRVTAAAAAQKPPERQETVMKVLSDAAPGGGGGGGGGGDGVVAKIDKDGIVKQANADAAKAMAEKTSAWNEAAALFPGDEKVKAALEGLMKPEKLATLTVEQGRSLLLEAVAASRAPVGQITGGGGTGNVTGGASEDEKFNASIEAALIAQHMPEVVAKIQRGDANAGALANAIGFDTAGDAVKAVRRAEADGLRGLRLSHVINHYAGRVARRAGMKFGLAQHDVKTQFNMATGFGQFAGHAVGSVMASGGASTSDFTNLLSTLSNKFLMVGIAETPAMWPEIAIVRSVPDFKAMTMISLSEIKSFADVPEGGRPDVANLSERAETLQATAKGLGWGMTWQAAQNDDLGGFLAIPRKVGTAYVRSQDDAVFAKLLANPTLSDSVALFHATHNNLETGAAMNDTTMAAAVKKLMNQTGFGEEEAPLGLIPSMVVCGTAYMFQAGQLYNDLNNPFQATSVNGVQSNPVRGLCRPVVSPRVTGNKWFVFADPAVAPVLAIAFLNGQRTPTIMQTGVPSAFGVEFEASGAFGVAAVGYEGAVYNPGP